MSRVVLAPGSVELVEGEVWARVLGHIVVGLRVGGWAPPEVPEVDLARRDRGAGVPGSGELGGRGRDGAPEPDRDAERTREPAPDEGRAAGRDEPLACTPTAPERGSGDARARDQQVQTAPRSEEGPEEDGRENDDGVDLGRGGEPAQQGPGVGAERDRETE